MTTPQNRWLLGTVSAALISYTLHWEGTKYVPYEDVVGVWTVCTGYAGKDVVKGRTYSQAECDSLLHRELDAKGREVLACTTVPLNQNQFDAFTLFAYNVGGNAFCRSSLAHKLNSGDYTGACNGLLAWDMAGEKHIKGLKARREFEREICLKEIEGS